MTDEQDFIDISTPDDIEEPGPPEPLEFKWKSPKSDKWMRLKVELRWPDDPEILQVRIQEAMMNHREAYQAWKRTGKKETDKPRDLWAHYRLLRREVITHPTWLHSDVGVQRLPPPVQLEFHGALLERAVRGSDFQIQSGLRSNNLEMLKESLFGSDLDDGSDEPQENSENPQQPESEPSSTPPSEAPSDENDSNESPTLFT